MDNVGWLFLVFLLALSSCSVSKSYNPTRKIPPDELREDYRLMREILESKHPSLYWYTPKDSMDSVFDKGYEQICDSMTERTFGWQVLAPVLAQIRCGHTGMLMSKQWLKATKNQKIPSFPLYLKVWDDTMMVVRNINKDSSIRVGDFILSIDEVPAQKIIDSLFGYLIKDGYSDNLNYIRLSSSFPQIYGNVFGLSSDYQIAFIDSNQVQKEAEVKLWQPKKDTVEGGKRPPRERRKKISRKQKREWIRSLSFDSGVAIMDVNAFLKGNLHRFFRRSFRDISKQNAQALIIDLRINGGGDINKAVKLARFIRHEPFRIADSAYSTSKFLSPWSTYISKSLWNNIALIFASKKQKDGKYHFGYWERKMFKPMKKHHFDGDVYVLTNGLTFSAASLFCALVKGQDNITIVGEETGGGWYGNSGIIIPDMTLPNSRLRVRLPFFRLVQFEHQRTVKGSGVPPDWYIGPDWRDVLQNRDTKLEAVLEKISKDQPSTSEQ